MNRSLALFLLGLSLFACSSCSQQSDSPQGSSPKAVGQTAVSSASPETLPEAREDPETPESVLDAPAARKLLDELKISYSVEAFLESVRQGDSVTVELFLAAGMDPNSITDGQTPLYLAAAGGCARIAKRLIEAGADPRKKSGGWTPLRAATNEGDLEVTRILLDAGADPNELGHEEIIVEPAKWGNFEVVRLLLERGAKPSDAALVEAASGGQVRIVRLLLEAGADPNAQDNYGTALMRASAGYIEMMQDLLNAGAAVNARDADGDTALLSAWGYENILLLLQHGADVNVKNNAGETPLIRLMRPDCVDARLVELLLQYGADTGIKDSSGKTAIAYAEEKGRDDIVRLLKNKEIRRARPNSVKVGAKAAKAAPKSAHPLKAQPTIPFAETLDARKKLLRMNIPFTAETFVDNAKQGDVKIVELFLKAGIEPDIGNHDINNSLINASEKKDLNMVRLLLDNGADPNYRFSPWDTTALMHAISAGHIEMVETLLKHGADINAKQINGTTPLMMAIGRDPKEMAWLLLREDLDVDTKMDGRWGTMQTALDIAAGYGDLEIAKALLARGARPTACSLCFAADSGSEEMVDLLLKHDAAMNEPCFCQGTPLRAAAGKGHLNVLLLLLKNGADIEMRGEHGWTELLSVVKAGVIEPAKIMIQKGADVNARDYAGSTALMFAAEAGNTELVKALLDAGADPTAVDKHGATALSRAKLGKQTAVVEILENAKTATVEPSEEEMIESLFSRVTDVDIEPSAADWDNDSKADGAEISISLSGPNYDYIEYDGIPLKVEVKIYARNEELKGNNPYGDRDRLIYSGIHTVTGKKDLIKIPYDDIDPLRPSEKYEAIDVWVTLPNGKVIEQKTAWGFMIEPRLWKSVPAFSNKQADVEE